MRTPLNTETILAFAREQAGGIPLVWNPTREDGDAYRFELAADGALHVWSTNPRGALYAAYDVAGGKRSGQHRPRFPIRGLFPCDASQRMDAAMWVRFIDRLGRWRMNVLPLITHFGYFEFAPLIRAECAKRGIEILHYTYYQFAFCRNLPPQCHAVDRTGKKKTPFDFLETDDRACACNAEALALYRKGVRDYLARFPDHDPAIWATPDGCFTYCEGPDCRRPFPVQQAEPFFDIWMEETEGRVTRREFLVYFQRFVLPANMERVRQADAIMFDVHTRDPMVPLEDPDHRAFPDWAHYDMEATWKNLLNSDVKVPPWPHGPIDPRARGVTANRYLWERLVEWRDAFPNDLYVHENLMIQGAFGVPRFNTRVYLDDLDAFERIGLSGVVYEGFEPGIRPFLASFQALADAMWGEFEENGFKEDTHPELHEFYDLVRNFYEAKSWSACHSLVEYVLERPDREEFDWLFIGYQAMLVAQRNEHRSDLEPDELDFVSHRKLWDMMEHRPDSRAWAGRMIERIQAKTARP